MPLEARPYAVLPTRISLRPRENKRNLKSFHLFSVSSHSPYEIYVNFFLSTFFQTIILYPTPNIVTCTMRIWLREIGFALAYGALMLKTWRYFLQCIDAAVYIQNCCILCIVRKTQSEMWLLTGFNNFNAFFCSAKASLLIQGVCFKVGIFLTLWHSTGGSFNLGDKKMCQKTASNLCL